MIDNKLEFKYLSLIIFFLILAVPRQSFSLEIDHVFFEKNFKLTHTFLKTELKEGNKLFYYNLHLDNRHRIRNKAYKLISLDTSEKRYASEMLWIDEKGEVWIGSGKKNILLKEMPFGCGNFCDGESFSFILVDEHMRILAHTKIFPKPVEAISNDGATICLKRTDRFIYSLEGNGFLPNEQFICKYISAFGESEPTDLEADEQGEFTFGIFPPFLEEPYGKDTIVIKRKHNTELKIQFLWGITKEKLELVEKETTLSLGQYQQLNVAI